MATKKPANTPPENQIPAPKNGNGEIEAVEKGKPGSIKPSIRILLQFNS